MLSKSQNSLKIIYIVVLGLFLFFFFSLSSKSLGQNTIFTVPPKPQVLEKKEEPAFGFTLNYQKPKKDLRVNVPYESGVNVRIYPGSTAAYSFSLSGSADNNLSPLPQFAGDSNDCPALSRSCSWIAKSTYGMGYRLPSSTLYRRLPLSNLSEIPIFLIQDNVLPENKISLYYKFNFPKNFLKNKIFLPITYTLIPSVL